MALLSISDKVGKGKKSAHTIVTCKSLKITSSWKTKFVTHFLKQHYKVTCTGWFYSNCSLIMKSSEVKVFDFNYVWFVAVTLSKAILYMEINKDIQ